MSFHSLEPLRMMMGREAMKKAYVRYRTNFPGLFLYLDPKSCRHGQSDSDSKPH